MPNKPIKTEERIAKVGIPVSILKDRKLSALEAISEYLKESLNMNYHEIAVLMNRDDRTIWTVYNRAKKKRNALANN
ncbi:MAG: hypothetical protein Q7J54_01690 [Candidatus Woesearchaeota archaeon]|nr:hypothetical protein [Candidatus Woesearchaeota archaeon]